MRFDLGDEEWAVIEPLLPTGGRGPKRVDDRRILNDIFYILRTGAPWRDLPKRYGPRTSVSEGAFFSSMRTCNSSLPRVLYGLSLPRGTEPRNDRTKILRRRLSPPAPWSFRISVSSSLLDGYDDPEILPYSIPESCLMGADGAQSTITNYQLATVEYFVVEWQPSPAVCEPEAALSAD